MVRTINQTTFACIEKKLTVPIAVDLAQGITVSQVFGAIDSWKVKVGGMLFFLNPINRRWLFFDVAHNDWRNTNHFAGEIAKNNHSNSNFESQAFLTYLNKDKTQTQYYLPPNTLLGNERNCDIKLSGFSQGSNVALILQHKGGFTIFSLGATCTITVNDQKVESEGILLPNNSVINIQGVTMEFVLRDDMEIKSDSIPLTLECRKCGVEIDPKVKYCTNCGTHEPQQKVRKDIPVKLSCQNCNQPVERHQKFCTNCGVKNIKTESLIPTCDNCGSKLSGEEKYCTSCGKHMV